MSSALAIAGVTAVLRDLLNNGLIDHNVSGAVGVNVMVSALPPDRVVPPNTINTQLNLFLHKVTPNIGWRNVDLPSRNGNGARLTNPPLALDLHYILSAYGAEDLHGEILLGYAMQLLHENPVLPRASINTALDPSPAVGAVLPPALRALADSGLADQVEQIKITPEYMSTEEVSKLWAAFQTNYRPTAAYLATVVLIQSEKPANTPLPVLTRNPVVSPHLIPPVPTLTRLIYPPHETNAESNQVKAQLGEEIILEGHHLSGSTIRVRFSNKRLPDPLEVAPQPNPTDSQLKVKIPNNSTNWVAGIYTLSVLVRKPGESHDRVTNQMPFVLAPTLNPSPPPSTAVVRAANEDVTVTLKFKPKVRPNQTASLILGQRESYAQPFSTATNKLVFVYKNLEPDDYWIRLRIDGVDSLLVDRPTDKPPEFELDKRITVPA
jgi:Pvc16 N-terminal domain